MVKHVVNVRYFLFFCHSIIAPVILLNSVTSFYRKRQIRPSGLKDERVCKAFAVQKIPVIRGRDCGIREKNLIPNFRRDRSFRIRTRDDPKMTQGHTRPADLMTSSRNFLTTYHRGLIKSQEKYAELYIIIPYFINVSYIGSILNDFVLSMALFQDPQKILTFSKSVSQKVFPVLHF